MYREPLEGSQIEALRDIHSTTYVWSNGKSGIARYPVSIFLIFWLCGWTVGGFTAIKSLITSEDMPLFGKLFMLFWLGGWAFGEVAVIYVLYNMLKPPKPARLKLSPRHIEYETGTKAFDFANYQQEYRAGKRPKLFGNLRSKVYSADASDVTNLKLQQTVTGQRLSFDVGIERVEIGEALTEPEREWLYEVIKEHVAG